MNIYLHLFFYSYIQLFQNASKRPIDQNKYKLSYVHVYQKTILLLLVIYYEVILF